MIIKSYLVEQNFSILKASIVLFYGENLGLKNDYKTKIIEKFKDQEIYKFTQDEIIKDTNFFFEQVNNISLFGKEKVFIIDDASDKILNILEEVENKGTIQHIYLFSNILDRKSKIRTHFEKSSKLNIIACYSDNVINIKKIILDKLKGFEGLNEEIVNFIAENCNLDRVKLTNELNKIITYFTNKKIEKDKLDRLLNLKTNEDFNILKDEALNGNKIKTNKLLGDTVLDLDKTVLYLNIINQRMLRLINVLELAKKSTVENAADMIKPPIFWKEKNVFISQAKKWNPVKLRKIINKIYDLELRIKSNNSIDKNLLLKKLLIDICISANA